MTKKIVWLVLPLSMFCMAFDPATDNGPSVNRDAYLRHLLKMEATLQSAALDTVNKNEGISTRESTFGADPYRILHLPRTDHYLILLRNASRVLLCDSNLQTIDSCGTPRHPVAFELIDNDLLLVGGELSGTLRRYKVGPDRLEPLPDMDLNQVVSIKDLVYIPETGALFLLDDYSRHLVQVDIAFSAIRQPAPRISLRAYPIGAGPSRILSVKNHLIVNLMLDHTLLVLPLQNGTPDFSQATRIHNSGPFWSVDALVTGETLVIAAGGIENHPLSRETGEFGYLDSFLYLFFVGKDPQGRFRWQSADRGSMARRQAINLSEHGLLTPKAVVFQNTGPRGDKLWVAGYGSDRAISYTMGPDGATEPHKFRLVPGISDMVIPSNQAKPLIVCTSPLLDCIIKFDTANGTAVHRRPPPTGAGRRVSPVRVGEMLFFTDLMSPNNSSGGELSRFTCEACHFEGLVDGRVHFTGRDAIHATTKPVRGLANNVPLFSRGGDESLSSMVMAEFQVANQHRKGFFTIRRHRYPWMSVTDHWPDTLTPLEQRESLLAFFTAFDPQPNPWRVQHPRLSRSARKGLAVFKERCADCHQPVRSTRTGDGVNVDAWERWLTDETLDLVWGAPFLSRTGVTPYVDPSGARVPSLRRAWMKYPLFTNGSAKTIREVLSGFRYRGDTVYHRYDGGEPKKRTDLTSLTPKEIDHLEALLRYF